MYQSKNKCPVYLVVGDTYERECEIKRLIESFSSSSKDNPPLISRYFADEITGREVFEQLQTFPLFASKQIVHLKRVERLKKDAKELLITYLDRPNDFTLFILEGESLDKRETLFHTIQDKAVVKDYSKKGWARNEAASFSSLIRGKVNQAGKKIEPKALRVLEERCGDNLFILDNACEKLILYAGEENLLTVSMVEAATEEFFLSGQFDLTESLLDRNPGEALRIFHNLLETRASDAVGLIGIINWQLKRIWDAKRLLEEKVDSQTIGRQLSIKPYFLKNFLKRLEQFPIEDIERALERLYELDSGIKRGSAEPVKGIEALIIELTA